MFKDILVFLGSSFGMIFKFILIIALALGGVYSFCTMFMFRFLWDGAMRLGICAICVVGIIGLLLVGREKDADEVTQDDFRP